jgi:hypothetical protein
VEKLTAKPGTAARMEKSFLIGGSPETCFVAMWFSSVLDDIYGSAIRPAMEVDPWQNTFLVSRQFNGCELFRGGVPRGRPLRGVMVRCAVTCHFTRN